MRLTTPAQRRLTPAPKKVASLIKEVKREHIPIIFYEELSIPKVASLVNRGFEVEDAAA